MIDESGQSAGFDAAETCVSCGEILKTGDLVYIEHGEGGYICADCAPTDPESYVDEDEQPLKPGDPIPAPFAYDGVP